MSGFDLSDLSLTRDGVLIPLTGNLSPGPVLVTTDNIVYTLSNLAPLTSTPGSYSLTLASGSGITDGSNHNLAVGTSSGFVVAAPPQILSWQSIETHARGVGEARPSRTTARSSSALAGNHWIARQL